MKKQSLQDAAYAVKGLRALSNNLWWSWNPEAQSLFQELSPLLWETSNHNPVAVLAQCSEIELQTRLRDKVFLKRVSEVLKSFDEYMKRKLPFTKNLKTKKAKGPVAYFCAEFGIHECLPIYSGGLGILAGDHVKSASDLGIEFIGIGLFYKQGYFRQHIDAQGYQQEEYPVVDPAFLPVELVTTREGSPLLCEVNFGDTVVHAQAWRINVGRSILYLLDTDIPENDEQVRGITARAYGGDVNTRIRQEIVLGIGGVKLLRALKISPCVYHMNEGHASFLTLELLREYLLDGIQKKTAEATIRGQCIFTTHTPVAAGHDRFPRDLMQSLLYPYMHIAGMSIEELMGYGQSPASAPKDEFTMTILGLKLSRAANGVSEKHGEISRRMWNELYPDLRTDDVPIGYITNGVHIQTWTSPIAQEFWKRHSPGASKDYLSDPKFWKQVTNPGKISDEELWALRYRLRRTLVEFIRNQAQGHHAFSSVKDEQAMQNLLSSDALTIGFARRFAPYKRAPLIFSDVARITKLLQDVQRPVQIIYAGKAHPRDGEGKEFLHHVVEITQQHSFGGRVVFLENYDMNVARYLVSGCDVWLNNPRRPLEASGTSGEKVTANGGLHFSILDGWWREAYNGKNGWAIGDESEQTIPPEEMDKRDADSLYNVLSNEVIPMFYDRDRNGIPRKWIAYMRNAMRTIIPEYNTHRMVMEYVKKYYFTA